MAPFLRRGDYMVTDSQAQLEESLNSEALGGPSIRQKHEEGKTFIIPVAIDQRKIQRRFFGASALAASSRSRMSFSSCHSTFY
jgi:hypothetical protein